MADASGNTANFLKDLGVDNGTAINTISDGIGFLADLSGAGGIVLSVLGFIAASGSANQTDAMLQKILDTINNGLHQIQEGDKAGRIIARLTDLTNVIAPAKAVYQTLAELANAQPPISEVQAVDEIQKCITSLDALSDFSNPGVWRVPFPDQTYWTDAGLYVDDFAIQDIGVFHYDRGYGARAPKPEADSTVFDYTYILPTYLYSLSIFLAVAEALDPSFPKNHIDSVLRPARGLLNEVHNEILNEGITLLTPVFWDGSVTPGYWDGEVLRTKLVPMANGWPGVIPLPRSVADLNQVTGAIIEYGAVETFSGASVTSQYVISFNDLPSSTDPGPNNKFQLALLAQAKALYKSIGLTKIRGVINALASLAGDPPLPEPSFDSWSFRNDVIRTAKLAPDSTGSISLRAVARFILFTPPLFIPPNNVNMVSFRALLAPSGFL